MAKTCQSRDPHEIETLLEEIAMLEKIFVLLLQEFSVCAIQSHQRGLDGQYKLFLLEVASKVNGKYVQE